MTMKLREASPRSKARIAGAFYFLSVITALFAEAFVRGNLLYAVGVIPVLCFAAATLILFGIFKPVQRTVALFAALSNLVGLFFEAVEWHVLGINAALVFHGIYCVLIGYLVTKSTFLPRVLGVPMAGAGLAWLTALSPHLDQLLRPMSQILGFIGEGSLMLWLLITGVNVERWFEGANESGTRGVRQA
jgi:Domain of unknown function (DUF4386)